VLDKGCASLKAVRRTYRLFRRAIQSPIAVDVLLADNKKQVHGFILQTTDIRPKTTGRREKLEGRKRVEILNTKP
jgi:hypothetical protein